MTYDPSRQRVVMFGGFSGSTFLSDTWEWDGSTWTLADDGTSALAPIARSSATLFFDSSTGELVLNGGIDSSNFALSDTWSWDGSTWQQRFSTISPSARYGAMTAQDGTGVVMFGGRTQFPGGTFSGETWRYLAQEWVPVFAYTLSPLNGRLYARTPRMSWFEAEAIAGLEGGHLATVRSQAENDWLVSTFFSPGDYLWIGLSDAAQEGQWEWSSGEPVQFTNWEQTQPDDAGGQDFAAIWDSPVGSWDDTDGMGQTFGIVELALPPASYSTFGSGCPGPTGATPSLGAPPGDAPRLGQSSVLRVSNLPLVVTVPLFVIGFSRTEAMGPAGTYALPIDLGILGWPGCDQLVSLDDPVYTITTTGVADRVIAIPTWPALAGLEFYCQALVLYAGGPVAVTNGLIGTLGY